LRASSIDLVTLLLLDGDSFKIPIALIIAWTSRVSYRLNYNSKQQLHPDADADCSANLTKIEKFIIERRLLAHDAILKTLDSRSHKSNYQEKTWTRH